MQTDDTKERGARGVLILTVSNLLVKAAGLLFKIPMNYAAGDAGMGYYNAAFSVYALIYTLTTAGIPVALSVMIAELKARGNAAGAKETFRRALAVLLTAGGAGTVFMYAGADALAALIRSPGSAPAARAIAPALFFICASGAMRGYFQGTGNLTPTAVSQLAEAFGKVGVGLAGALAAVGRGYATPIVAAYAALGVSAGSLLGTLVLVLAGRIRKGRDFPPSGRHDAHIPLRATSKRFLQIALPVTLASSVVSLSSALDTLSVQRILREAGRSAEEAAAIFGNYTSLAVPMFNLPPALVYPAAWALVPAVASALAEGNRKKAEKRISAAMEYALLIGIPCAAGLSALSLPILSLFYRDSSAVRAAPLLALLAPASCLVCLAAVTGAALQGAGGQKFTVVSMTAGAFVKWAAGEILLRKIGIAGAPLSTFACYLTVSALNLVFLGKIFSASVFSLRRTAPVLFPGLLCGWAARRFYEGFLVRLGTEAAVLSAIAVSVPVYALLLTVTGVLRREEAAEIAARFLPRKRKEWNYDGCGTERKAVDGG